jgi:hypothetical protein
MTKQKNYLDENSVLKMWKNIYDYHSRTKNEGKIRKPKLIDGPSYIIVNVISSEPK